VSDVAPDGSPVDVYLALPFEADLARVRAVIPSDASILDLGSGPGRLSNPLAADGHDVVAVDDSADMLSHIVGASAVLADVWQLDLGRKFDVVMALSHLINDRSASRRIELLETCRRHLADTGVIVLQRFPPDWSPLEESRSIGDVGVRLFDVQPFNDDGFAAAVEYRLGEQTWIQRFEAAIVGDAELNALSTAAGLIVRRSLDDERSWMLLAPEFRSGRHTST
jgi:SAM-dependent methyltransferase